MRNGVAYIATNNDPMNPAIMVLATSYSHDAINRSLLGTKNELYGIKRRKGSITGTTARQIFG
jgi:hypothetical protein